VEGIAVALPGQDLQAVAAAITKDVKVAAERVSA
jgi:hypothetical protein